jgi:hypothetical protein
VDTSFAIEPALGFAAAMRDMGSPIYNDEFACELLAWFYLCGGNTEVVVLNNGLNFALRACASQLGIEGGRTPDPHLFLVYKGKLAELRECLIAGSIPDWCQRILDRYNLREPKACYDFCFREPDGSCPACPTKCL